MATRPLRFSVAGPASAAVAFTVFFVGAAFTAGAAQPGQDRAMAVTVDDLPVAPPGLHSPAQQADITERLLAVFAEHGVPAIGFVNESKLEVDGVVNPGRVALLERWLEAGQSLGNHGYAHLDLHRVPVECWLADIGRGERVTRALVEAQGGELRWFRHPYLHLGRSAAIQQRVGQFLAAHGYKVAPVTVDNGEWVYARAYADALNRRDRAAMAQLGTDYLRYMLDVVTFYEGQAKAIIGGPIPQVLLVHANALNADWLGPLLDALEGRGYHWVSLEAAVEDPAYRKPVDGYTGPGGITWLHRWAITAGRDRAIFRGEPEVPGWVEAGSKAVVEGRKGSIAPEALVVKRAEVWPLRSAANGVDYELRVSLPHGYGTSKDAYPVVYTLDADYSFLIARNITDHLAERGHLPEVIVGGVAYRGAEPGRSRDYRRNRSRDYTPTRVAEGGYGPEYQAGSGGGPAFLQVLENEIVPFVDRHYRTAARWRTLVGHSYGGLFAVWAMLSRPGLFSSYVAVSPSLWYDDHSLLRLESSYAADHRSLPGRAYLCVGSREHNTRIDMVADLTTLVERLRRHRYEGLELDSRIMTDETHNSVFPGCLSNGLRFVLRGR